jgi:hypothetical protein
VKSSWRQRIIQTPELADMKKWPLVLPDELPIAIRKLFLRNQSIVSELLNHYEVKDVANRHNVSTARISQLMNRCLGGNEPTPPLNSGLIPNKRIFQGKRRSALDKRSTPKGHAYSFRYLLGNVPGLEDGLDNMILAKLYDKPYAQMLSPSTFHGMFKTLLIQANWPSDQYPYTCSSVGYEAVRKYLHIRVDELNSIKLEKSSYQSSIPAMIEYSRVNLRPFRQVQIDEHLIDLQNSVHLELDNQLIPLRIARATLIVAIDVDTSCILAYILIPSRAANQYDFLELIELCISPWKALTLETPNFKYTPGACFPSSIESLPPFSPSEILLDNARMHKAMSVVDFLCVKLGTTLSFGLPGTPKTRSLIELIFNYINKNVSHRWASTSGSTITDPKRESKDNKKKPPSVSYRTFEEAISLCLTNRNITPNTTLGGATPLQLFKYLSEIHYVSYIPNIIRENCSKRVYSKLACLHWYRNQKRIPHINFQYSRYVGNSLLKVAGKEKKILIEYDPKDIRTVRATTLDGRELGELICERPWRRFAHSIHTRQWIHKNRREHKFSSEDLLSAYFHWLLVNKDKESQALTLLRVHTEFSYNNSKVVNIPACEDELKNVERVLGRVSLKAPTKGALLAKENYQWNKHTANHKG